MISLSKFSGLSSLLCTDTVNGWHKDVQPEKFLPLIPKVLFHNQKAPQGGWRSLAPACLASLFFGSSKAPWPWPWIGSRSHQHAQYLLYYQHVQSSDCSLTQYRNMAIWISWKIDILRSLNSRDSFPGRKLKNQAPTSCSPGPILSSSTISFELHTKTAEEINVEKCNFHNFGSSVTLTLDRVEVTLVHISGRGLPIHQIKSKSEKLYVDVRTNGRTYRQMYGHTWVPIY